MTSASIRTGLDVFLRAARAQLGPADLGLATTGRRRTPGLLREEITATSDGRGVLVLLDPMCAASAWRLLHQVGS